VYADARLLTIVFENLLFSNPSYNEQVTIRAKNYRVSLDYVQAQFVGGAALGLDRKTENTILTRFQVAY